MKRLFNFRFDHWKAVFALIVGCLFISPVMAQISAEDLKERQLLRTGTVEQLSEYAELYNSSGNFDKARMVRRVIVSRFPKHPLATLAAQQNRLALEQMEIERQRAIAEANALTMGNTNSVGDDPKAIGGVFRP